MLNVRVAIEVRAIGQQASSGRVTLRDIAAELLTSPALLFLAEPAAGLDPAQSTEVLRLLRRLCDAGTTVLLTTSSPLDAARCDKVAVLATGGHLTDERLAGLGDPAAAWSRRFYHFSGTNAGFSLSTPAAPAAGLAPLVPDSAGPHSAGRPSAVTLADDFEPGPVVLAADAEQAFAASLAADGEPDPPARPGVTAVLRPLGPLRLLRLLRPLRQSVLLARRNADVLARSRPALAGLAVAPVAVLLAFAVLFALGAFDPARPGHRPTLTDWLLLVVAAVLLTATSTLLARRFPSTLHLI